MRCIAGGIDKAAYRNFVAGLERLDNLVCQWRFNFQHSDILHEFACCRKG
jgi:hypothetical protein